MISRMFAPAVCAACVLISAALHAQDRNYWLQLNSFRNLPAAREYVREVSGQVAGLRIFRSSRDRYLVVSGQYPQREAAQLRARLMTRQVISEVSSITTGRHFRAQVWPSGSEEEPEPAEPDGFRLGPDDAIAAQTALRWFGDYRGAIDGIVGSGTDAAIRSFQVRAGTAPSGRLTRGQFQDLMELYNHEIGITGLETAAHRASGISLEIPSAMLSPARIEEPFVYFDAAPSHQVQLILVSLPGNAVVFESVFHALQANSFIPEGGSRTLGRDRFEIRSENTDVSVYADVRLFEDRIKGYLIIWHPDNGGLMERVTRAMSESLLESSESTLTLPVEGAEADSPPLVALDVPRPRFRQSGFYIDTSGSVATGSSVAESCGRILLSPSFEMRLGPVDHSSGIALLLPVNGQAPLGYARLRAAPEISPGEPVTVSGYSFGGALGSPSQTSGSWHGDDPRPGREGQGLIAADAYPGDVGGPVLDGTGAVAGILAADRRDGGRQLPEGIHPAAASAALSRLAAAAGIAVQYSFSRADIHFSELARAAKDFTVLVECY